MLQNGIEWTVKIKKSWNNYKKSKTPSTWKIEQFWKADLKEWLIVPTVRDGVVLKTRTKESISPKRSHWPHFGDWNQEVKALWRRSRYSSASSKKPLLKRWFNYCASSNFCDQLRYLIQRAACVPTNFEAWYSGVRSTTYQPWCRWRRCEWLAGGWIVIIWCYSDVSNDYNSICEGDYFCP